MVVKKMLFFGEPTLKKYNKCVCSVGVALCKEGELGHQGQGVGSQEIRRWTMRPISKKKEVGQKNL